MRESVLILGKLGHRTSPTTSNNKARVSDSTGGEEAHYLRHAPITLTAWLSVFTTCEPRTHGAAPCVYEPTEPSEGSDSLSRRKFVRLGSMAYVPLDTEIRLLKVVHLALGNTMSLYILLS